ncbi:site-specific integrase [Agromyces indicus]|uniref:Tyrosine-type recombinase/integrase n=1 Tax=Agromyces indicus TaxID=758919 RepID=A0ABU1FK15_9MICO|nr:tyrosine-type recombinase/integrase [Agromyces indicus]MDR5692102.1 tyrosine-type recombinase/integrase [Agromyces indicus]
MSERNQKVNRASFGSVRKLPSGRWQARYPDPAGRAMTAPSTFTTKRDALDHIAGVRADRMRGTYRDHRAGSAPFGPYAEEWVANGGSRGKLAPRTRVLYEDLLHRHLEPLATMPLSAITPPVVRSWYSRTRKGLQTSSKARGGTGETAVRQAYALLRSILATAVTDGLIPSNPCQIKGAGIASAPERPYMAPDVLSAIVDRMPERYHLPMQAMFGGHLRLGELVALERGDYANGMLRVERQVAIVRGVPTVTPTKTGEERVVALPGTLAAMIEDHLARTTGFPKSPMFTRPDGTALTHTGIQQAWAKARKAAGHPQFHVHDVRHAGLTLAAQAGATTRELMARAGHRTTAAAMTYQHVAEERGVLVADRMDALAGAAFQTRVTKRPESTERGTGLQGVLSLGVVVER